jgi:hypothetical protein
MYRSIIKLLVLVGTVSAGSVGFYLYHAHSSVEAQLEREQQRSAELRQIVQRLTSERRVADVMVTDQQKINGVLRTSIVFVEYGKDDAALPAKRFTVEGKMIHIDALVVKFDGKFVEQNDALRGQSIALFTRLYGDNQTPAQGFPIDEPGQIPAIYRDDDPKVGAFQQELWQNFWRLADDPGYRNKMGVRIAQGEGPWRPFEPDHLYTITIESNGGLSIQSEPLKGIYREALKSGALSRPSTSSPQ